MSIRNWTGTPMYEVIVGNVGKVHEGTDREEAIKVWSAYVKRSVSGEGRCAGEGVSLFYDDMEHGSDILPGYDYQPPEENM